MLKSGSMYSEIPEETVESAQAAFPKGNVFMQMRDHLGTFYRDEDFKAFFPRRGQPAMSPWRLALYTYPQSQDHETAKDSSFFIRW